MISHHYVLEASVLGKALPFCFCEGTSTKETKFRLCGKLEPARDDDMACTGGDCFEARKLASKTWKTKPDSKNSRTAVMSCVHNYLLHRHAGVATALRQKAVTDGQ